MPTKKKWTAKQTKAIELLALGEKNHEQIAKELDCNPSTISTWKRLPGFMDLVIGRAREVLKQSIPEVYKVLSKESRDGNEKHIKIFLDHLEKLEQFRANRASITFTWQSPKDDTDD